MLRRFFAATDTTTATDPLVAVAKLMRVATAPERSEAVLRQIAAELGGDVRGYVVRGNDLGEFTIEAEVGYGPELLELTPDHGPWRDPGPRIIGNLIKELFTPNSRELRTRLGDLGLRDARSALVTPVQNRERRYGAMVLAQHEGPPFGEEALKRANQWAGILGEVQLAALDLHRTRLSLVEFTRAFVEAMEAQDFTQLGHASRVTAYALAMGRALALSRDELADLYFAAMLHDIGKLGTGTDLSHEDTHHPARGANLVASSPLLANAAEGIRSHHESWDGSGYPQGLRKEAIPLLGRIVAVADVFDLLSSERGQALPLHEVEKGLEARSGNELDPKLVNLFINILRQGKSTQELAHLDRSDLPF